MTFRHATLPARLSFPEADKSADDRSFFKEHFPNLLPKRYLRCNLYGRTKILYVLTHIGGHQGFPAFLNEYHLTDAFQTAHLSDEGFHDYQRDHGQKHLVSADIVQFKYDKALVGKIQIPCPN